MTITMHIQSSNYRIERFKPRTFQKEVFIKRVSAKLQYRTQTDNAARILEKRKTGSKFCIAEIRKNHAGVSIHLWAFVDLVHGRNFSCFYTRYRKLSFKIFL